MEGTRRDKKTIWKGGTNVRRAIAGQRDKHTRDFSVTMAFRIKID